MSDKKKPGCLVNLLAVIFLIVLVVWGIKSCGDRVFAPETPEQAEKREQEEVVKAEKREQEEVAKAEKWKQEEAKQPERKELLQKFMDQGIFQKVTFRSQGATVWVGSTFYLLEFESKEAFCSVVYAYISTHAKLEIEEMGFVRVKDVRSGKQVGLYGQQWTGGVGLEME